MNKTISINIAGIIFNVNEDAYEVLKKYLEDLHKYFSKTDEGKEVYSDIEGRIAEIFSENITPTNQVITIQDVESVILTLGRIEDLIDNDDKELDEEKIEEKPINPKKRLYRDIDDKAIAGVAKGLSYYIGIDVVLIRIILILLFIFGGSGLYIYIILWIAMPEAKTTIQKLEMKGEPINLSNLEKNINEEFNKVKENFKSKKYHKDVNTFFEKVFDFFITITKGILKAFSGVFGVLLVVIGAVFLSMIVSTFLFDNTLIQINEFGVETFSIKSFLYFITNETNISFILLSLLIIIAIPILSLLYFGVNLIFGLKLNSKIIAVVFIILWIFGIVILTASIIDISKDYKKQAKTEISTTINTVSDTIFVKTINKIDSINSNDYIFSDFGNENKFAIAGKKIYIKPNIKIINYDTDTVVKVFIKYSSRGRNKNNAQENMKKIIYNWHLDSDTIYVDSHYIIDDKYRNQKVKIQIYKPMNKVIINDIEEEF